MGRFFLVVKDSAFRNVEGEGNVNCTKLGATEGEW